MNGEVAVKRSDLTTDSHLDQDWIELNFREKVFAVLYWLSIVSAYIAFIVFTIWLIMKAAGL